MTAPRINRIPRVHHRTAAPAANDARWPDTVLVQSRPRRVPAHRVQTHASPAIWRGIAWGLSLTAFGIGVALLSYVAVDLAVAGLTALLGVLL